MKTTTKTRRKHVSNAERPRSTKRREPPYLAILNWLLKEIGLDGVEPHKVPCIVHTKGYNDGPMDWEFGTFSHRLAQVNALRLIPTNSVKCDQEVFSHMGCSDLGIEMTPGFDAPSDSIFPRHKENLLRYIISFSEPVFLKDGIVVVGFPNPYLKKEGFLKTLFGEKQAPSGEDNGLSPHDNYWIGLYRKDGKTMVMDPVQKGKPKTFGKWSDEVDFPIEKLSLFGDSFNVETDAVVVGIARTRRKSTSRVGKQ